jgi:quinol monooxygenase YgiN
MGRVVIVAYKPKPGKESELLKAVGKHLEVLGQEGLVADRAAYVMAAADGTILEVFEWRSADSIQAAHANPAVQALWAEFAEACDYVPLSSLAETHQMFAEFDAVSPPSPPG